MNNNLFYNILLLKNIHTSVAEGYNEKIISTLRSLFMLVMNGFVFLSVRDSSFTFEIFGYKPLGQLLAITIAFIVIYVISNKVITYRILSNLHLLPKVHDMNQHDYLTKELFSEMTYTVLTMKEVFSKGDDIPELEAILIEQYMNEILTNLESCITKGSSDKYVGDLKKTAVNSLLNEIQDVVTKIKNSTKVNQSRLTIIKDKMS